MDQGPNDWPNGSYSGICAQCSERYMGPKRSIICFTCTEKNRVAWEALSPEEQAEMTRRFFAEWNEVLSPAADQHGDRQQ